VSLVVVVVSVLDCVVVYVLVPLVVVSR